MWPGPCAMGMAVWVGPSLTSTPKHIHHILEKTRHTCFKKKKMEEIVVTVQIIESQSQGSS